MTMNAYLEQRSISRYQLSKDSGIPWATLADICSGKTKLERCSGATLRKLANALHISIEELLSMDPADQNTGSSAAADQEYLEVGLPEAIYSAISEYTEGERANSSVLDCLWGELYGTINSYQHAGVISKCQADYLREKYLFDGEDNAD